MVNKIKAEEEAVTVFASMERRYRSPLLVFERARREESHAWEDDLVRECVRWRRQLEWKRFTLRNHNLDDADAGHEKLAQSIVKRRVNTEEHLRYGRTLSTRVVRRYWSFRGVRSQMFVHRLEMWKKKKNSWEWFHSPVGKETGDLIVGHDLAWIGLKLNCWQKIWCLVSNTCEFQTRNLVLWARSKIRFRPQSSFVCRGHASCCLSSVED